MRPKTRPEVSLAIVQAYREGNTIVQIGAVHGMHPSTVSRVLEREGIARNKPGRNTAALSVVVMQAILRQYNEGMGSKAIARLHDIHYGTVAKVVRRMGGVVRPSSRPSTTDTGVANRNSM